MNIIVIHSSQLPLIVTLPGTHASLQTTTDHSIFFFNICRTVIFFFKSIPFYIRFSLGIIQFHKKFLVQTHQVHLLIFNSFILDFLVILRFLTYLTIDVSLNNTNGKKYIKKICKHVNLF